MVAIEYRVLGRYLIQMLECWGKCPKNNIVIQCLTDIRIRYRPYINPTLDCCLGMNAEALVGFVQKGPWGLLEATS